MSFLGAVRKLIFGPPRSARAAAVRGSYDAARAAGMNSRHFAYADALDADAANSKAVRQKLSRHSRYEEENNGFSKGLVLTQGHYVCGRGPKLRLQTQSRGFNAMVEAAWTRWTKAVKFARKLRTAVKAKTRDGETFLQIVSNPRLPDLVQLDLRGLECEQVSSTDLLFQTPGRVDGIWFDEFGNVEAYDVLPQHPGGQWSYLNVQARRVPARYMLHLFREDRFTQHRAVPETTPALNLGAQSRRYRESTLTSAENVANLSLLLKTESPASEDADISRPFESFPMEKGMFVALPYGNDVYQPKVEQPAAGYQEFIRGQINEQARPLSMPYNIAAADSSGYSFSGGRLDHLTYFVAVDTDQADIEDMVLDPLFEVWFAEAVLAYGWAVDAGPAPPHTWDWPAKPQIDDMKTAKARETNLSTGLASLSRIYAEDGYDFADELPKLAEDYGVSEDEMRRLLLEKNILGARPAAPAPDAADETPPQMPPRRNGQANGNGNGRFALSRNGGSR